MICYESINGGVIGPGIVSSAVAVIRDLHGDVEPEKRNDTEGRFRVVTLQRHIQPGIE